MEAIADTKPKSITTDQVSEPIWSLPIWRLSVNQYHSMIANGILEEDAQLELLEGLLIGKMTKNPRHRVSTKLLRQALEKIIPTGWYVDSQEPITLQGSEPEPDVMLICGETTDYRDRHPDAASLELVVEVADTSLERDRTIKQRIYARAGIPIYWILNLGDRQLEIYTQPNVEESLYKECQILTEAESVCVTLRNQEVVIGWICVGNLL